MSAFTATDCQCSGRVNHGLLVPTVKLLNVEYMNAQRILMFWIALCRIDFQMIIF